jgi:hypothetical protein
MQAPAPLLQVRISRLPFPHPVDTHSLTEPLVNVVASLTAVEPSMSPNALQEIARTLDKVGEDIWGCDDLEDIFDLLQRISRLEAQLYVQRSLLRTAKLLREQPQDTALPQQMATRVKHFIKFTPNILHAVLPVVLQGRSESLRSEPGLKLKPKLGEVHSVSV